MTQSTFFIIMGAVLFVLAFLVQIAAAQPAETNQTNVLNQLSSIRNHVMTSDQCDKARHIVPIPPITNQSSMTAWQGLKAFSIRLVWNVGIEQALLACQEQGK